MTTVTQEVGVMAYGSVYTKSGAKTYVFRNSKNEEIFRFRLHGIFSVESGVGATCTEASHSVSIADTAWELNSASSYPYIDQAIGNASFSLKLNGITLDTKSCHVVLTCDKDGVLK